MARKKSTRPTTRSEGISPTAAKIIERLREDLANVRELRRIDYDAIQADRLALSRLQEERVKLWQELKAPVRVLRLIEYAGPRDKVEEMVSRSMHGSKDHGNGVMITVVTLHEYPQALDEARRQPADLKTIVAEGVDLGLRASRLPAELGEVLARS